MDGQSRDRGVAQPVFPAGRDACARALRALAGLGAALAVGLVARAAVGSLLGATASAHGWVDLGLVFAVVVPVLFAAADRVAPGPVVVGAPDVPAVVASPGSPGVAPGAVGPGDDAGPAADGEPEWDGGLVLFLPRRGGYLAVPLAQVRFVKRLRRRRLELLRSDGSSVTLPVAGPGSAAVRAVAAPLLAGVAAGSVTLGPAERVLLSALG